MITPQQATPDTLTLYGYLPQFVQDNDAANNYQFLTWLNGIIGEGSDQASLEYDYAYSNGVITPLDPFIEFPDTSEGGEATVSNNPIPAAIGLQAINQIIRDTPFDPGYSILLDINRCPTYALPWLGQFVGVRFPQVQPDNVMRQAIQNESAFQRGTVGAIASAGNAQMVASYTITVLERTSYVGDVIGYDPYAITISFPLVGVGSLSYGQLFADFSTYAAVQGAYSTYGAMAGFTTNMENAVLRAVPAGIIVYWNPF